MSLPGLLNMVLYSGVTKALLSRHCARSLGYAAELNRQRPFERKFIGKEDRQTGNPCELGCGSYDSTEQLQIFLSIRSRELWNGGAKTDV